MPRLSWSQSFPKWCVAAVVLLATQPAARADDFHESFDTPAVTGKIRHDPSQIKVAQHRRHAHLVAQGEGAEYLLLETQASGGQAQVEFATPAARVIDDFSLTVSVRSNRAGITPALRVILPNERDRATGEPLEMYVPGEPYTKVNTWQTLRCTAQDRQVRERLVLLRAAQNNPNLNTKDLYIDRLVLMIDAAAGSMELVVDELRCGPVVAARSEVTQTGQAEEQEKAERSVEFRLDRLYVEGRPFFPRMAALHDEPLEELKKSGINVVWVPADSDPATLQELRALNMWAAATPPQATDDNGEPLRARDAAMVPFPDSTFPILFWNLGTRVPPSAKDDVANWIEQVQNADRRLSRPIMLDVSGLERVYSRLAPMLGVSRHMLQTSFSLKDYRDWLVQRRKLSRPGSFLWTWVQTEVAPAHADWRSSGTHHAVVVEPEQIRLQTYAALASGCRGVGFWKTGRIDGESPGQLERRLILAQLGMELELMDSWLATGNVVGNVPFEVKYRSTSRATQRNLDFRDSAGELEERDALLRARDDELRRQDQVKEELEATMIRSEYGLLILPIWYERDAQFVPGQLAANDATIIVPGASESSAVWEVSTTGMRSLKREQVAGGTKIVLPKFDQTAIIVVTANPDAVRQLKAKIDRMAASSAETMLALSRAKLERTRVADEALRNMGLNQADAAQLLASATTLQNEAETLLRSNDYRGAREKAEDSLQLVRILQRAHWNDAVRNLSSPLSSPHTVSFETLVDHWQMIARVGRSSHGETNLLRSGDFEDVDTMVVEGWKYHQRPIEMVKSAAELYPVAQQGKYALRMMAMAERPPETEKKPKTRSSMLSGDSSSLLPVVLTDAPVTVTSPPVTVRAGQIVHVSGWVRVVTPVTASLDGLMIHDSVLGTAGALRWNQSSGWQRFEFLREVRESGPMTVTFTLTGLGEALIDDVRIVPHLPRAEGEPPSNLAEEQLPGRGMGLPFMRSLSRFPRLSPRRSGYGPETADPARIGADSSPDVRRN